MKTIKIVIKSFRIFLFVILSLMIVFFSTYIIKRLINKDKPVSVFNIGFYEVSSWSMYDYLSLGDLVVVVGRNSDKYTEGMVITYLTEDMNTPVTHKIVKREGDIITTRGINTETNNTDDEPFDVKYVIGEVKIVWHGFRSFMNFIKSPAGIIFSFLLISTIIAGSYFVDTKILKNETKNEEQQNES